MFLNETDHSNLEKNNDLYFTQLLCQSQAYLPVQQSWLEGNPLGQLPQYKPFMQSFLSSQSPSSISQGFSALQHDPE